MNPLRDLLLLLVIPVICEAQKQGNIWYFGNQAGLDFSNGTPTILTDGLTGTDNLPGIFQEGTACIADSTGNILFYTGGKTIWNRYHAPMPNGTGILGGTSSTHSSIIIPLPGSDSIFYLFTSDEFQVYTDNPPQKGYRLTVLDICLDKGRGDVITGRKNILLCDSSTEKLSACVDAIETGYWIVGHKMFSDEFYAWHLTSGGITDTVVSKIGTVHGWRVETSTWFADAAMGQMKINPQGTKLALAIGNNDPAVINLFDFNSNTGVVDDFCHIVIDSSLKKRIYGIEFSPDGKKLYAGVFSGIGGRRVYQFDIAAGDCNAIIASRQLLFQPVADAKMLGMQIAPNGKIYLVANSSSDLSCINFPDSAGFAAGFDSVCLPVSGTLHYTLPTFVAGFKYHNGIPPCADPDGIDEYIPDTDAMLFPNPNNGVFSVTLKDDAAYSLDIFNMLGEHIYSASFARLQKSHEIDISTQPEGVYFVRIKTNDDMVTRKVIVVK